MKNLFSTHRIVAAAATAFLFLASFSGRAATINWINSNSAGWNAATNWSPNLVPGASDTAIITNAGVTVSLNGPTTVGAIILGTNGPGTVTLSLNNQTLALNGPLRVNSSGSFTVDSGALVGNTNAVLSGTIGWTAAFLGGNLTLASGGTLNITTGNNHDLPNCTLTNNGTVTWTTGEIRGGGSGTFIYNNGLWNAQNDSTWDYAYAGSGTVFNNAGTFRKSGSAGGNTTFNAGVVFNNTGKLDSQTSYIVLTGGGNFTGGTATNLVGFVYLNGGAFTINGTVTSTNVQLAGATLTGDNVISGGFNWIVGDWNNSASETIAPNSTLLLTSGNNHNMANCTVTNNGTVAWNNGTIQGGGSPGTFIYNNGLWDAQNDQTWNNAYAGNGTVFNNLGTFRKSGGVGEFVGNTYFAGGAVFNQLAGVIDVQQNGTNGTQLALLGGGSFTGGYVTTNSLGLLNLAAGGFNFNGTVTGTNTWLNGGTLVGNNLIKGALNWVVGDWNNSASETIAPNATLLITSANNHNMQNCTITNNGTVAWLNGLIQSGGSPGTLIVNNGVWDAQSDQQINNAYAGNGTVFNNLGTFRKSGGAGEFVGNTYFAGGVVFNQLAGVIDVQQNGTNGTQLALLGGGSFSGGYVTTNSLGLLNLAGGGFNFNGAVTGTNTWQNGCVLVGDNFIKGALTWVVGNWDNSASETIATNSLLLITSANNHNMANCTVTNNGTVAWIAGTIQGGGNPGTFIYNNGVWDSQSDQTLSGAAYGGAGTVFNNRGTLRKSGGASEFANNTVFNGGVVFNQLAGVIDVQNGTNGLQLNFQGGGNFTGGYITTNVNGLTVLGAGGFVVNGTVTGTNTWENNGNLVGTNVINGNLTWVGGFWNGALVTISANSKVLVIGGGGVNDFNAGVVTNHGTVAWASGTIRGGNGSTIYNYGLWDAQSDQQINNGYGGAGSVFNNFGTFRKSAGTGNTIFAGGVLFNQTSGLLSALTGNILLQGSGNFSGGSITNSGVGTTYLNAGGFNLVGTTTDTNVIENAGNLVGNNVINGALNWVAGNWNGATVTISNSSVVTVAGGGGVNDFNTGVVTNYGTVAWASGQMRGGTGSTIYNYGLWDARSDQQLNNAYGGASTVFNNFGTFRKSAGTGNTIVAGGVLFNQTSGLLSALTGNILLQGSGNFSGGSITNSSSGTTYLNAGNFNLNSTITDTHVVENSGNLIGNNVINGALNWVAGVWSGATVTISNNSVVTVAGGGGVNDFNAGVVTNYGTVAWASGQMRGGNGSAIYNYGLWNAQSDQQLNNAYGGASTVFNNFGTFRKEFTSGITSIAGGVTFNNTGTMDAQDGNIALQGAYTLANGTKMGFGLGGPLGNGSISLSGAASFAGSLSVNLNGFFWPAVGSSFNLLNYTSETGVLFTNATLPAPGYLTWQTNYNATFFTVTVTAHTAVNPAPANLLLSQLNSSNLLLQWPGDHTGWRLQAQTNPLTVGLRSNWATVTGSSLTNQLVMPVDKNLGTVFFRMIFP